MSGTTPSDLIRALDNVCKRAQDLLVDMRESPGGDEYIYEGSTNGVDDLRDAIHRVQNMFRKGKR